MIKALLKTYAKAMRDKLRANAATPEPGLAPAFQTLVETLLPYLPTAPQLVVSPEYAAPKIGRPDIALIRPGQPPRAFIELKAPAKDADPERWKDAHDKRQYERLKEFRHWATSNFVDFYLFEGATETGSATIVPRAALKPETPDAKADKLIDAHDHAPFIALIGTLAQAQAPEARDARHLAELLAHSSRLTRSIVGERLAELHQSGPRNHALLQVRETFRDVLYAHPEAGGYSAADFDTLFSAAFAQTLAFGMLLVRESSGEPVAENAWQKMPNEHPLMRTALRVLSMDEVVADLGIGFDLMRDTVNSFAPAILAIDAAGRDPILYFYEDFLQIFDPRARERYGVYYTPIEVVRYMVGALDRALRDLGTEGLRDDQVNILDPATGTGTFPLGVIERVRQQVEEEAGPAQAQMAVRALASRLYGFELLVGPYAVAHYRLHHALARPVEGQPPSPNLPRLGVYLADTLAAPGSASPAGPLGFVSQGMQDERREANRIKSEQPILAIIGNPPYRRLEEGENETLVGRWMDELWSDLKRPVSDAGQGGQLNTFPELSVAFWRWAMWKLFEAEGAPKKGVVAFITNRKYLTGWPYAGLRKMMRERFDRIEIVDLRGDVRAGPRGDVTGDTGVFNIQVGTAIAIAIADGSKAKGALANVTYTDSWTSDLFERRAKLAWLSEAASVGSMAEAVSVHRDTLDDLRPTPFASGEWLSIREVLLFSSSGVESTRDALVVGVSTTDLQHKIETFVTTTESEARVLYSVSRKANFQLARLHSFSLEHEKKTSYRPLDTRFRFQAPGYIDWPRPKLSAAWGVSNYGLFAMPFGTGAGPSVWAHPALPDRHAFSNRGGYAFPLYDRRAGPDAHNLSPVLLAHLAETYGQPVSAEDVFDAILALLSATSYTRRFAEDLEDVFPHIPFPADHAVLMRAVAVGREIRAVETFARKPTKQPKGFCQLATSTTDGALVAAVTERDGEIVLCADGSGRITGIPDAVWRFAVSGYRVLPRWIDGRKGQPADLAFIEELQDVAARIAELIHRFDEADLVLADTLAQTLTRAELGFPAPEPEEAVSDD